MKKLIIVFFAALFFNSCGLVSELNLIDPELPTYTESGQNVGAARSGDALWKSKGRNEACGFLSFSCVPSRNIWAYDDRTFIMFYGDWENPKLSEHAAAIIFEFKNITFDRFEDISNLEIGTYTIPEQIAAYVIPTAEYWDLIELPRLLSATNGIFHLRNFNSETIVRNNNPITQITISGTFGFDLVTDSADYSHHYGVFDYEFREEHFIVVDSIM